MLLAGPVLKINEIRWPCTRLRHHVPIKEGQERAVALDQGVMLEHHGQRLLVEDAGACFHSNKLLAGQAGEHFVLKRAY